MKDQYYLQIDRKRTASFSLPDDWTCAHFVRSEENDERAPCVDEMLRDALARVDDVPQLRGSASSTQKAAIIVDDLTRPTPVAEILAKLMVMRWQDRITITPGVRSGKPCIKGTRITVYDVLEYLAGGMTESQILADFPDLTEGDIRACLAFAASREHRLASSSPA